MNSESTWKDRIKAVASAVAGSEPASPLLETLEEFRATLDESPWIRAELRPGPHPRQLALVVSPKYRRDISGVMLTFWLKPTGVAVTGAEGKDFETEEALREYLADFVEKTAFPDTVAEFRAIQGEHVHGTLRVKSLLEDDPGDLRVLVDAADHNALAKRALDRQHDRAAEVGVVVEEAPERFDAQAEYGYLESGGFGLRIAGMTRVSPSALRLHGDVVPLEDLPQ